MTTGKVKSLAFSEGTTVTSATTLTIDTAKLAQYASDAAFVAAKGLAAAAGDVYFNTVDSAAKEYTGAAWRHIVTRDGTETLTAKTLTSPVINTGSLSTPTVTDKALLTETTSPATPSAGFLSMFAKADHKVYLKDSTGVEAPVGGGLSPTYKAANFTASAANNYLCNTTAGALTATLPAGSTGSTIRFTDDKSTWAGTGTRLTITPNGTETIQGLAAGESLVCDVAGAWVELNWDPTNSVWVPSAPGYTTSVGTTTSATTTAAGLVDTATQSFAGIKNNASMPAFRAKPSTSVSFTTASGILDLTGTNSIWDDTLTGAFDQGSNFTNGTGTSGGKFTVPAGAGGIYSFWASLAVTGTNVASGDLLRGYFRVNGSTMATFERNASKTSDSIQIAGNITLSLAAGDTVSIAITTNHATTSLSTESDATANACSWGGFKLY